MSQNPIKKYINENMAKVHGAVEYHGSFSLMQKEIVAGYIEEVLKIYKPARVYRVYKNERGMVEITDQNCRPLSENYFSELKIY